MSVTDIVLDGTTYAKFKMDDSFHPKTTIGIDLDLNLPDWNYENSSQIVGNYDGQGYGVFYQKGFGEVNNISIFDGGNNQLFTFNRNAHLVNQRNFPTKTNPTNITAYAFGVNGEMVYFDAGNNVVFTFDSNNILTNEFVLAVNNVNITKIQILSSGNILMLDKFNNTILEYSSLGDPLPNREMTETYHTNFVVDGNDMVSTFFSNPNTPMLLDNDGNYYNLFGVNLYKNGVPFFFVNSKVNTFGIDNHDNIWMVYQNNQIVKINTNGKKEFDKIFHEISPCKREGEDADQYKEEVGMTFTTELTDKGLETFAWVVLSDSNFVLKLNSNADIVDCISVISLLDTAKYSDVSYENTKLKILGDINPFYPRKYYNSNNDTVDSFIKAKFATINPCNNVLTYRELSANVTGLQVGVHNIKFVYDGVSGDGSLSIDGVVIENISNERGEIYYDVDNLRPTLIGADSGNFRAKQEELGILEPIFFKGIIEQLSIYSDSNIPSTKSYTPESVKMEFDLKEGTYNTFKERVDKMFLFRGAGFKSPRYNLRIKNSGFDGSELDVINDVGEVINTTTPKHTVVDDVEWVEEIRFKDLSGDPITTIIPIVYTYEYVVKEDNPVSLWRLQDTAGITVVDEMGVQDGDVVGNPSFSIDESATIGEKSMSFDGENDWIEIDYNVAHQPTDTVSIEALVYMSDWGDLKMCSIGPTNTNGSGYGFWRNLAHESTVNFLSFAVHRNGGYGVAKHNVILTSGWHHLVGTFDGQYVKMYVDGVLVDTDDAGGVYPIYYDPNLTKLVLANDPFYADGSAHPQFATECRLRDSAMYNYPLTQEQITTHYNSLGVYS